MAAFPSLVPGEPPCRRRRRREHPGLFDYDREYVKLTTGGRVGGYPGGGGYTGNVFNVAYSRAMMQAALESV
jgi:mannonate dehydratase